MNNQDFESVWYNYIKHDYIEFDLDQNAGKAVAEYFFNAGVASTQKKTQQVPALFKPKDTLERNSNE